MINSMNRMNEISKLEKQLQKVKDSSPGLLKGPRKDVMGFGKAEKVRIALRSLERRLDNVISSRMVPHNLALLMSR